MRALTRVQPRVVALVVFLIAAVLYSAHEYIAVAVSRSPDLAYTYCERHFNAITPREYDVDRAEYFFTAALNLNPNQPFVHHELGRIAFLRGDFDNALWNMNRELEVNQ